MATVKINNEEYNLDDLTDKAKENLASLQFVQNELKRQQAQIAVLNTAASAYSNALNKEINN